jgi:hypothetical protein
MHKLELSISLLFGLFLLNVKYLLPASHSELTEDESWQSSFDVTYTPDAQHSDIASWGAWGDLVKQAHTNETLVQTSTGNSGKTQTSSSLATASSGEQTFDRSVKSLAVAPTQKLWKGESWSDGITIETSEPQSSSADTSNAARELNALMNSPASLFPSMFFLQGQEIGSSVNSNTNAALSALLAPNVAKPASSKVEMTILPASVTLNASSEKTATAFKTNPFLAEWLPATSSTQISDARLEKKFPWIPSLLVLTASASVLGMGLFLSKRFDRTGQRES